MDVSKAAPGAAAAYMENIFSVEESTSEDHMVGSLDTEDAQVMAWFEKITSENLEELAERVESTVQVLIQDADGTYTFAAYIPKK